jgi:ferric-dicitrate binding protein FerR (iron transport regulator)
MDFNRSIKEKIVAYLQGELSKEELEMLAAWISRSEENARFYTQIKDIWEASRIDFSEIAETEKEWKKFISGISRNETRERQSTNVFFKKFSRIAAILTIGIIVGNLVYHEMNKQEPLFFTSIAPEGSMSEIVLPDSSVIFLNSGSQIRYSIGNRRKPREVFLRGEAMFRVKNVNNRPFIVHTISYNVNVLGTEFNVRAYDEDNLVETTLQKGSVMISSSEKSSLTESVTLKPGEQLVYNRKNQTTQIDNVNALVFTSWKEESFSFSKVSLKDLMIIFERRFGVKIEVKNMEILNYHYSGAINKNETLKDLLDIIKQTLPIQYEIDKQNVIIKVNRQKKGGQ